jgi:Spy/CpxP family protein refolding chaperone
MKRIVPVLVVAGLVAGFATTASAQVRKGAGQFGPGQGRGMMMMGGGGTGMLLANPGVQKELKLTEEQRGKVETWAREQREKMMGLRDASPEERRELMTKMESDTKKAIAEFLKPEQSKRLDQIRIQNMGLAAFEDETVDSALKITDDQKDKIRSIQQDGMAAMRELFQGGGDRAGMMQKITEMRKDMFNKAVALLTSEQKTAWNEVIGEPFEVTFQPRRNID